MKKVLCTLALAFMTIIGSIAMTACGDKVAEKISIKPGSVETKVLVNTEHDISGLVLEVEYDDDSTAEVTKNDEMTITEIDTSVIGDQELVVEYLGLRATLDIEVVSTEGETYSVIGYQKPQSYTFFESNKSTASSTNDMKFKLGDRSYKVGDDNKFKFLPIVTGINDNGDDVTITKYRSIVTVKENGTVLEGTALSSVVAIDDLESTFDFTPDVVGNTYTITVQPEEMPEDATYDPITFTVEVVNGWNAYDIKDLSRIENNAGSAALWADKKEEWGIDNTEIDAIVLHNDISIGKNDLPSTFFHPAGTQNPDNHEDISGTLIDSLSFFTRDIDYGDTFTIYGNYFTIQTVNEGTNKMPVVKYLTHDGDFGHSAIFSFGGDNNYHPEDAQGKVVLDSLSLKGNGLKVAEESSDVHGSLIAIVSSANDTQLNNCLMRAFNSHIVIDGDWNYSQANEITTHIKDSKLIDSFGTMMVAWGSRNNYIENSVLKNSGGPLVIATHVDPEKTDPEHLELAKVSNLIVKNSTMESLVGGSEAWFQVSGAAPVVGVLKAMSTFMKEVSAELLGSATGITNDDEAVNFLACTMGNKAVANTHPIWSLTSIQDAEGNVIVEQNMLDPFILLATEKGYLNPSMPIPIIKAGNTYVTMTVENELVMLVPNAGGDDIIQVDLSDKTVMDNEDYAEMITNFFASDYANMYIGPVLGSTFQMFHTQA